MSDLVVNPKDGFSYDTVHIMFVSGSISRCCQTFTELCHRLQDQVTGTHYRKVPKFSDARQFCCYLPKNPTKSPNIRIVCQKDVNGIANSEDHDQTAP